MENSGGSEKGRENMAELRKMTENDIPTCVELYLEAFPKEGELEKLFRSGLPGYFRKYIKKADCFSYVLTENEEIIGLITAIIIPSIGDDCTHFDTVAIAGKYQHQGYGTQMMKMFMEQTECKIYSIYAERDGNGYKLYEKVGFDEDRGYAVMHMIPGITDRLIQLRKELAEKLGEKWDQ